MAYVPAFDTPLFEIDSVPNSGVEPNGENTAKLPNARLCKFSISRALRGGRLDDFARIPRYAVIGVVALAAIWVPIAAYMTMAPERFTSSMSLILPGTGVSTSVNLSEIGQASTSSNSAYSSSAISPTVTYQKLFQSGRVISRAAQSLGINETAFGRPRVRLIDQTSFLRVETSDGSAEGARDRAEALLSAFRIELSALRDDEIKRREQSITGTVAKYQNRVNAIRDRISVLQLQTGLKSADQFAQIIEANEELRLEILRKKADLEETREFVASLQALLDIAPENAAKSIKLQSDPQYAMLSTALSKATTTLAGLSERYGPRHPEIVVARKHQLGIRIKMLDRAMLVTGLRVEEIEDELEHSADSQRGAMLAKLAEQVAKRDGLIARMIALEGSYDENAKRSAELIPAASELDKLSRDYKVAEAVFTSALARVNVSRTDIFASYPMVQIAEPPSLPWEPSSPNLILAIIAGIAASIFSFLGLCLGWMRRPLIDRLTGAVASKSE